MLANVAAAQFQISCPCLCRCLNTLHLVPSQPEPNPLVVMDIDNSTAIDTARAVLSTSPSSSRASGLLLASLVTDLQTGVRTAIPVNSSIRRFDNLSPAKGSNLDLLKRALEALDPTSPAARPTRMNGPPALVASSPSIFMSPKTPGK